MNAVVMTEARRMAVRDAKEMILRVHGHRKLREMECRDLHRFANAYLATHPELIERAAETVRKVPQLRTLAERHERKPKGNRA
jgi:hypothetical protein